MREKRGGVIGMATGGVPEQDRAWHKRTLQHRTSIGSKEGEAARHALPAGTAGRSPSGRDHTHGVAQPPDGTRLLAYRVSIWRGVVEQPLLYEALRTCRQHGAAIRQGESLA